MSEYLAQSQKNAGARFHSQTMNLRLFIPR
jgi:hypothetical protein